MSQQNSTEKKKMNKGLKILLWIAGILLFLVLALIITFFILKAIGKSRLLERGNSVITMDTDFADSVENDGKTVYYNGEKYILNENITAILGMGVDKTDLDDTFAEYGINGQADCLFLITIDTATGKTNAINISRETMTYIDIYSVSGNYSRSEIHQLCLAFAYGDGKEKSCENVVKAVSRYIYGMPINSYFCFDFEAVSKVNDMFGGITVKSLSNITFDDGTAAKAGESITLHGNQALKYVRTRSSDLEANNRRMQRQTQYVKALTSKIVDATKKNITTPVAVMNKASENLITNIDISKVTYLADCFISKNPSTEVEFKSIAGEVKMGEKYVEFHEDEKALFELILEVFYNKAEK